MEETTLLFLIRTNTGFKDSAVREVTNGSRLQRLWRRLLDWMMEPIPFPSKTYDIDQVERRYNQGDPRPSSRTARNGQRRPPRP
jgi:hypothetical protein